MHKAMILAAGRGSRLGPLAADTPKCMLPIGGRPLLEHTIQRLRTHGVAEIMINLHYLPHVVMSHFGNGSNFGVRISYSLEEELLGTAGAVKKVESFFDEPFFLWYGDNLSTCRLDRLSAFHQRKAGRATVAVHRREETAQSGIAGLELDDRITRFVEKPRPEQVFSHWVSAGIFVLEPEVLSAIPGGVPSDFGRDIFPALLANGEALYGYRMGADEQLWWIDTPDDLSRVQSEWQNSTDS